VLRAKQRKDVKVSRSQGRAIDEDMGIVSYVCGSFM